MDQQQQYEEAVRDYMRCLKDKSSSSELRFRLKTRMFDLNDQLMRTQAAAASSKLNTSKAKQDLIDKVIRLTPEERREILHSKGMNKNMVHVNPPLILPKEPVTDDEFRFIHKHTLYRDYYNLTQPYNYYCDYLTNKKNPNYIEE